MPLLRPRFVVLSVLALVGAGARAQQGVRVVAQVTGVAGAEVYLDRGTADGLAAGDTVVVERDGVEVGKMVVLDATGSRAVATFAGAPFAITRGEQIVLAVGGRAAVPEPEPPPDSVREARASLFESAPPAARPVRSGPRLTGRLQSGVFALRSTTRPEIGDPVGRTYASPYASLRAEVDGLPGGARLRLDGRTTVRWSDAPSSTSVTDLQLTQAAVDLEAGLVHLEVGRFLPDADRISGYWDGASVRLGTDRLGAGGSLGVQPDRTNGLPAFDLPKAAAFAYGSHHDGPVRADGAVSLGHLFSERGVSFGGATGSATYRSGTTSLRATGSVLGDGDAADGWSVSRASLRAGARIGMADASAAYSRYRPSALTTAQFPAGVTLVPVVRETVTGRLGVRVGRRGPEVYASGGVFQRDGEADGASVGGGLRVARLPVPVPVGVSLDATTREAGGFRSLYASARATTRLGPASLALGVRLSQSATQTSTLTTTGVEGSLSAPLSRRVGVSVVGGVYGGGGLGRTSLYTSIWTRL